MQLHLFAADQFSNSIPKFKATTKNTGNLVRGIFENHYRSLGPIRKIGQVGELSIENIKILEANACNFRLRCGTGEYVLKYVLRQDIFDDLEQQLAMCAWLWEQGLPVAEPIETDGGRRLVERDDARAYVLRFREGRYFAGEDSEIEPAGRAIGAIMKALAAVPDELSLRRVRPPYFTRDEHATLTLLRDRRSHWGSDLGVEDGRVLEAAWQLVESGFEEISACSDALNSLPRQLTHYDLHPHNILMKDGIVSGVLDFDACYQLPVELGIGFATSKLLKRVGTARAADPRPGSLVDDANRFLDAVGEQLPSATSVRSWLKKFAKAETVRRLLSVCRKRLDGRQHVWHGIAVHAPALAEIDLIFE